MAGRGTRAASVPVREFARRVGVTERTIRKAIQSGRLAKTITTKNGHLVIRDAEAAAREWQANRGGRPEAMPVGTVLAARLRALTSKARLNELEYQRKRGELVPKVEVELAWTGVIVAARTKLLGLAARIKQRLPHLTVSEVGEIDGLVREALEELASGEERKG